MISKQVRRGIKIACINENITIVKAAESSGVSKTSIYRFMGGSGDIWMAKLDKFCRLGLGHTLDEILQLGNTHDR